MANLHNLHVDADTSEFTSTSGTVTADAAAAMAATAKGLKVVVTGAVAAYGQKDLAEDKPLLHGRVYHDRNSTAIGCNFVRIANSAGDFVASLYFDDSGTGSIECLAYDDASGEHNSAGFVVSDAPHWIEWEWKASTAPGANNGYIKFWVDKNTGAADMSITDLDNDTLKGRSIRYGAITAISDSGTFYMDEMVVNDDGGLIGVYTPFPPIWQRRENTLLRM